MFERFTDRARRVVVLAQEEARMLNHNWIGTEHILLGLIHEGEGVAVMALEALDVSLEHVRAEVERINGRGEERPSGHIPFTPRGKKVLELSLREALQLGHNYIGTEHILLGLVREGEGVAARALAELGVELRLVRLKVVEILSGHQPPERLPEPRSEYTAATRRRSDSALALEHVRRIISQLEKETVVVEQGLARARNAPNVIGFTLSDVVASREEQLSELEGQLSSYASLEDSLMEAVKAQERSDRVVRVSLGRVNELC